MSFSPTDAYVCVFYFYFSLYFILFIPSLGQGLMAGLWILLAMGVVPSCRVALLANGRILLGT